MNDLPFELLVAIRYLLARRKQAFISLISFISIVGVGMRSHSGVAAKMFEVLSHEGVNIMMISTSEIKISCVIDEKYMELAMRALHAAFGLYQTPVGK